uniref:Uncharacterized protein n=1 Tax=Knipowitschia caucasica TaxID=637954 RepID=A0AAV2IT97_KNICA
MPRKVVKVPETGCACRKAAPDVWRVKPRRSLRTAAQAEDETCRLKVPYNLSRSLDVKKPPQQLLTAKGEMV